MKKPKISVRETIMLIFLVVLLIAVIYYMGFYTPLQGTLAAIEAQSSEVDAQITNFMDDVNRMNEMQAELDEILSRPAEEITEIAPYDNKEVVLNQLYGILGQAEEYSLSFTDPEIQGDGIVRRNISMNFVCEDYTSAKGIIQNLSDSHWRCLVSNLAIVSEDGDMMRDDVSVTATITYFEHTGLT